MSKMGMVFVAPFFFLVCLFLWHSTAYAEPKSYVVYLGSHSHGPQPTVKDFKRATDRHHEFLGSFLGSKEKAKEAISNSFRKHINGFTANLEDAQAIEISKHPDVVSVFPNKRSKLQTTRSWYFLGMEKENGDVPDESIWAKSKFGEDVIIGVIDSGVYPESPSFNDEGMGPVPSRWKGFCQKEEKNGVRCNRKLIGARFFDKFRPKIHTRTPASARDYEGHGTHVMSIAGGRYVPGANFFGYANGTAKGGAPNARLASYNSMDTYDGDVIDAFDAAIHDGVDIISTSMAGRDGYNLLSDGLSIGALHAVNKGIIVTAAAGNNGPYPGSVENVVPWVLTVGASTIDRDFYNYITLGNNKRIKGSSLSSDSLPLNKYYPLIDSRDAKAPNAPDDAAEQCVKGSLDPKKVKGKVVVCMSDDFSAGSNVRLAGGVGMIIICSFEEKDMHPIHTHSLPATWLTYSEGSAIYSYLGSTKSPVVSITKVVEREDVKPAPSVARFSSRGPNKKSLILKPDVIAPGNSILAAYSLHAPFQYDFDDPRRVLYYIDSGTSMASPHAAGLAGLLKALYLDWSPFAIQSAIMTTAHTRDNLGEPMKDYNLTKATPFAYGSGHIRPNNAMDPGLVYDLSTHDYLNFLCASGLNSTQVTKIYEPYSCPSKPIELHNLNYPSISVENVSKSITITRTLKNVGSPGTYKARVQRPHGVSVVVKPKILHFQQIGEEKTFQVTLKPKNVHEHVHKDYVFGRLIWSDGKHYVGSPIVMNVANTTLN